MNLVIRHYRLVVVVHGTKAKSGICQVFAAVRRRQAHDLTRFGSPVRQEEIDLLGQIQVTFVEDQEFQGKSGDGVLLLETVHLGQLLQHAVTQNDEELLAGLQQILHLLLKRSPAADLHDLQAFHTPSFCGPLLGSRGRADDHGVVADSRRTHGQSLAHTGTGVDVNVVVNIPSDDVRVDVILVQDDVHRFQGVYRFVHEELLHEEHGSHLPGAHDLISDVLAKAGPNVAVERQRVIEVLVRHNTLEHVSFFHGKEVTKIEEDDTLGPDLRGLQMRLCFQRRGIPDLRLSSEDVSVSVCIERVCAHAHLARPCTTPRKLSHWERIEGRHRFLETLHSSSLEPLDTHTLSLSLSIATHIQSSSTHTRTCTPARTTPIIVKVPLTSLMGP